MHSLTNLTLVAQTLPGVQDWSAFVVGPLRTISQVCVIAHEPYRSTIGSRSPPQGFTTVSHHTTPFVVWLKICLRETLKMLYNCIGLDLLDFLEMSISCARTLADFLTSEGVLLRPDVQQLKYCGLSSYRWVDSNASHTLSVSQCPSGAYPRHSYERPRYLIHVDGVSNASIRTSFNRRTPLIQILEGACQVVARVRSPVKVSMTQN
jgi:hypothetical protein